MMELGTFRLLITGIFIVLSIILFSQSWYNLFREKITKYSIDGLTLAYIRIIQGSSVNYFL